METPTTSGSRRGFCSTCGTRLDTNARFCHECGTPVGGEVAAPAIEANAPRGPLVAAPGRAGIPAIIMWGVPAAAAIAVLVLVGLQYGSRGDAGATTPLGGMGIPGGMVAAPDISSMTPEERADRLFNRVMRLASEGHTDSAAFFGPMALGAFEALGPLTAHARYDMGLVALVTGDLPVAKAQADSILAERPTHLLGLALAARTAEARGDAATASALRRRLIAAEPAERAAKLQEYEDHDSDIREAVQAGRG